MSLLQAESGPAEFFDQHGRQTAPSFRFTFPFNSQGHLSAPQNVCWYPLILKDFPREEILREARALKNLFVEHRSAEPHRGWKSLCVHGLSAFQTQVSEHYGVNNDSNHYRWTEIASQCPETVRYFTEVFPAARYERIRFMLVEAGGYILPHRDKEERGFGPLAICLNRPDGCEMVLEKFGKIPWREGQGAVVDISYLHSVWNRSAEDRFHLHIEMHCDQHYDEYRQWFLRTFEQRAGWWSSLNKSYRRFQRTWKEVK